MHLNDKMWHSMKNTWLADAWMADARVTDAWVTCAPLNIGDTSRRHQKQESIGKSKSNLKSRL